MCRTLDKGAAQSMSNNKNQQEIDASWYADPHNKGAVVNNLDVSILSALQIDTDFNVNVMTGSDGVHSWSRRWSPRVAAAGAKDDDYYSSSCSGT